MCNNNICDKDFVVDFPLRSDHGTYSFQKNAFAIAVFIQKTTWNKVKKPNTLSALDSLIFEPAKIEMFFVLSCNNSAPTPSFIIIGQSNKHVAYTIIHTQCFSDVHAPPCG